MGVILFGAFIVLILIGLPIAVAIGLSGTIVLMLRGFPLMLVPQRMFASIDTFALVAVPFFILAGDIFAKGQISKRLVDFVDSLLGFIKGGLSIVVVVGAMFFAGISGSAAADTAAIGAALLPEMKRKGYKTDYSAALIATAGTIGVVIPPSVPMIIYAMLADQSVAKLFIGGFVPGILMGAALIAFAIYIAYKYNYPRGAGFDLKRVKETFFSSFFALLTPFIILGGIFSGVFTPSEAAAIAVDYALIIALFFYREISVKDLYEIFAKSAMTTALVLLIISTSGIFSWVLASERLPQIIAGKLLSLTNSKFLILLIIDFLIIAAGTFMETASALVILTPVFLPVVEALHINLVHFGLIMVTGLAIGMVTPPVAICLYVASSIANISLERISRAVLPMVALLIVILLLITYVPELVLLLPKLVK
ncbi:MAG: TRAP transporter large permease [Deferribacteres bacterium]|nr:TRAP transporter large permease [Deferribacteres bacterium]